MSKGPFIPRIQRPPSQRSTESPMDFTYQKPRSESGSILSSTSTAQIRPLEVIDRNSNDPPVERPRTGFSTWFGRGYNPTTQTRPPPRKRNHSQVESMDWEPSLPSSENNRNNNPGRGSALFSDADRTGPLQSGSGPSRGGDSSGSTGSLPTPPVYTAPSKIVVPDPKSSTFSLPAKLPPESLGLKSRNRDHFRDFSGDQDGDSSMEVEVIQSGCAKSEPSTSKYSKAKQKREKRQNLKSLNQISISEDDDDDEEEEEEESDQGSGRKKKGRMIERVGSQNLGKPLSSTTNNYLTINGWKDSDHKESKSSLSSETPYTLLVYLQLLFNSSIVLFLLYLLFNLIWMIRNDINHKILVHSTKLQQEIEICTAEYQANRCFPLELRTKFIEKHCITWEKCMNQDPKLLSRSKIVAETFAEVMNGFVDAISWKTMIFILLSIGAGVYATNLAMNSYKSKWDPSRGLGRRRGERSVRNISTMFDSPEPSNYEQKYFRDDEQKNQRSKKVTSFLSPTTLFLRKKSNRLIKSCQDEIDRFDLNPDDSLEFEPILNSKMKKKI